MLTSFSNFFFVSFDSTGFISVDKAPLSLWVDALFAKLFGFNGFVILLPHALEGMAVTILMYLIVKKVSGTFPALFASLVITLSPVNVAVYRNNTPDALLLVFTLLTILFFLYYFETKKMPFLLWAAVMLGLGFTTKMLQAFLILPALLLALLIFAEGNFFKRIKIASMFTAVLLIVSCSWITIVDLTPATLRPFVGSSATNSAWNLAIGYNGIQRFEGETGIGGNPGFNVGEKGIARLFTGEMGTQTGWFLLTAILFAVYFVITNTKEIVQNFRSSKKSTNTYYVLITVATIFLATQYVFFSFASFFHSYYLNIFAIPIAILLGGTLFEIIQNRHEKFLWGILAISAGIQSYLIYQATYATFLIPLLIGLSCIAFVCILFIKSPKFLIGAKILLIITLCISPLVWSGYTTLAGNTATAIFIGGPSVQGSDFGGKRGPDGYRIGFDRMYGAPRGIRPDGNISPSGMQLPINQYAAQRMQGNPLGGAFGSQKVDADVLAFLKKNNTNEKYFVAVPSSQEATGFILDENIGNIMNLGGFSGRDVAIDLVSLQKKITAGEIRFFYLNSNRGGPGGRMPYDDYFLGQPPMFGGTTSQITRNLYQNMQGGGMFNANEAITTWVKEVCMQVEDLSGLYDCNHVV